ncbi:MAG: ABC transporter ATP-binding protein [Candidatus Omnitrophica bacterium]|nr:ABC transporter ATP-binding protein [Candidatus Omnitrophota bacterium]
MIIQAKGLHKYYKTQEAELHVLNGINLNVKRSEFLSFLGASGAGKSTLLHLLSGLDNPSEGEVLLNGRNLYTIGDKDRALIRNRDIGFVFQFYHLLPEFSALENVMLPALIKGERFSEIKPRAFELLKKVGLKDRTAHNPSALSGGEQQRVAIARSLINSPRVLFCDEPTGNLDSKTGENICQLLRDLNKFEGHTIIIATHSKEIADISTRMLFIKDGIISD